MDSICKGEVKPYISGKQRRNKLKELSSELSKDLLGVLKSNHEKIKPVPNQPGLYQTDIRIGSDEMCIANPLEYQLEDYERFIKLLPEETKVLFVGMASVRKPPNGIPFYDSKALDTLLKGPPMDFPDYIIKSDPNDTLGSDSGEIFWGCMKNFFNHNSDFFRHCFLVNFCPLIFMNKERTRNISDMPDNPMINALMEKCNNTFREIVALLKPTLIVPIGRKAESKVEIALEDEDVKLTYVCQPISCFYDEPNVPVAKKIDEWRIEVETCLGGNATWKEVTSKKRVADLKIKNEEGMI